MKKRNSTSLKHRMRGRWLMAFRALAPSLNVAIDNLGDNVPCPVEGGVDGFRLFKDANETGAGVKQAVGVIHHGLNMLMWVNDWSFVHAYDELNDWLGDSSKTVPIIAMPRKINTIVDDSRLRNWLNNLWSEAVPLTDLKAYPARAYFNYRRINMAAMSAFNLKYHPCLNYKDKKGKVLGTFGAILSLVTNNDGQAVSIHRTFITKCGRKANCGEKLNSRSMTPPIHKHTKGRQVRLFQPVNGYLGVTEGLETALAVYQRKQFPVWTGISNTMLQTFVPPKGVHTVLNFVDKDRKKVGEESSKIMRSNLELNNIDVIDLYPPTPILETDTKGVDWWDQLIRDPQAFDVLDEILSIEYLRQA